MKRSILLLPVFLTGVLMFMTVGCGSLFKKCESADSGCGEYQACCSSTKCHYEYNGKEYECDGTDCTAAAEELVDDMCDFDFKSAEAKSVVNSMVNHTNVLTEEARLDEEI